MPVTVLELCGNVSVHVPLGDALFRHPRAPARLQTRREGGGEETGRLGGCGGDDRRGIYGTQRGFFRVYCHGFYCPLNHRVLSYCQQTQRMSEKTTRNGALGLQLILLTNANVGDLMEKKDVCGY